MSFTLRGRSNHGMVVLESLAVRLQSQLNRPGGR
jgi:hypothetical protein